MTFKVTVIEGDGVGPEVISSALRVVEATGVDITWDRQEAGKKSFEKGIATGVPEATIDSLIRNKVALKGPLETPIGYGGKSANVTLRKLFETFGNIRPAHSLPGVITPFQDRAIDLTIIRENVEDLYTGIEHMQTPGVAQCLKLITRRGCEKIVRLAFEFARAESHKVVHCATKANIMKMSEGMLKRVFEEIAPEYPEIEAHHIIVDNCAHQLVIHPEQFDVIVTTNLNGDILSDLASGLVGGLGFAPSGNIGTEAAIFEAVHGSAPTIAGQNIVNPTSVILSSAMMLRYLGAFEEANAIEQGVYKTLADGIFTADVTAAKTKVSTTAFTDAVIERLGQSAPLWEARTCRPLDLAKVIGQRACPVSPPVVKDIGVDIVLRGHFTPETLGAHLETLVANTSLALHGISNRGMQVYPTPKIMPDLVDAWQCRFKMRDPQSPLTNEIAESLIVAIGAHYEWAHIEKLMTVDDALGYTAAQGEA